MGTKHGPEITVVCPILLYVVRLRSYLGNNTGTVFLWKGNETSIFCIYENAILLQIKKNKNTYWWLSVGNRLFNALQNLDFLPVRDFEHGQLQFCQCLRPPVLPSLLWCEHPLQKAEEGSMSWSPTEHKNSRLVPMEQRENNKQLTKQKSRSHQVLVQQVQRCSRNVSSTEFFHPTNSVKTSQV